MVFNKTVELWLTKNDHVSLPINCAAVFSRARGFPVVCNLTPRKGAQFKKVAIIHSFPLLVAATKYDKAICFFIIYGTVTIPWAWNLTLCDLFMPFHTISGDPKDIIRVCVFLRQYATKHIQRVSNLYQRNKKYLRGLQKVIDFFLNAI